jgi:hypothetical protein
MDSSASPELAEGSVGMTAGAFFELCSVTLDLSKKPIKSYSYE